MIEDLTRTAAVFTTLKKTDLVFYALSGTERLGCPYCYDVTLLSENPNIGLSEILGQPICVALRLPNGRYREFNGFVTRFSFVGSIGRHAAYSVQVEPWLALLRQRVRSRIYQGTTVPVLLKDLFAKHGFSDVSDALKGKYRTFDYLVQYRESDLNFVLRIMQQEGIYFYFKHHKRKHELVLADSYSSHEAVAGYDKVPYYQPQHNERRERDHLDQWLMGRSIRPATYTARDFTFMQPTNPVSGELRAPLDHAFNEYEVYDYPAEFVERDELTPPDPEKDKEALDNQVRIRLEEEQASFEMVHGAGNARGLQCGALFTLDKYPRKDQNKEYLIVEAGYTVRVSNYDSLDDLDAEPEVHVNLVAQDSQTPYRSPRSTKIPKIAGPQTATVVGPKNQEIWTDEYGRVRLQFHWDREGKSNENSSCWVRVSQAWAGQKWGSIHIPRIGQEVVVSFLEGNPNRPIVTGRVYNADNKPPYDLTKNQTQSGIKSRSTKDGTPDNFNEIRFEDKKGEEELFMQAEKNMTVNVKKNQSTSVGANRSASVGANDSVSVTGDRSVTVEKKHTVTVTAADTETYKDTRTVNVTGPDTLTITKAHTGTFNNARTNTITNLDTTTAKGGKKTDVTGNFDITASTKYEVTQGANKFTLTGATAILTNGKSTLTLDGGKVTIEAPEQIELKVGGNTVTIASAGTIDVTAASKATISGTPGASLALSAASADLSGAQINVSGQGVVTIGGPMVKIG